MKERKIDQKFLDQMTQRWDDVVGIDTDDVCRAIERDHFEHSILGRVSTRVSLKCLGTVKLTLHLGYADVVPVFYLMAYPVKVVKPTEDDILYLELIDDPEDEYIVNRLSAASFERMGLETFK